MTGPIEEELDDRAHSSLWVWLDEVVRKHVVAPPRLLPPLHRWSIDELAPTEGCGTPDEGRGQWGTRPDAGAPRPEQ